MASLGGFHEGWDRTVNRPGARDMLVCYCGEEVACYHTECLAMRPVEPPTTEHDDDPTGDTIVAP